MTADVLAVLVNLEHIVCVTVRMCKVLTPRHHHEIAEYVDGATILHVGIQVAEWSRVLLPRLVVTELRFRVNERQVVRTMRNGIVVLMLPVGAETRRERHVREAADYEVLVR